MAHNFTGDLKEYLNWWQCGKCYILVYERRLQEQEELNDGQRMSGWWWGVMVWRMLSCSIVMEHMPKPQQKLRQTLHFSVWVVVGSVFFRLSFP